ncbi:hypothetical protein FOZ60_016032, partial [Perkinsus olseni]
TRPDGMYRTVDKIGEKIKVSDAVESFVDRDDCLEYHFVKLDRNLRGTDASRSLLSQPRGAGGEEEYFLVDSLGDISSAAGKFSWPIRYHVHRRILPCGNLSQDLSLVRIAATR